MRVVPIRREPPVVGAVLGHCVFVLLEDLLRKLVVDVVGVRRVKVDPDAVLEEAEGYRARVVNEATGEASRFSAVLTEYLKAPDVTRKRLYLETMEEVLGSVDKVIIDQQASGQGVVPYLPLNQLRQENK